MNRVIKAIQITKDSWYYMFLGNTGNKVSCLWTQETQEDKHHSPEIELTVVPVLAPKPNAENDL